MLEQITPVILTFNEEQNIGRNLEKLFWANEIIVVDSGSTDATLEILSKYENIRLFHRVFDLHSNQWNFAISETGIKTEWILAMDADYILSDEFINEIKSLKSDVSISGYRVGFKYCISGKPLRGSLYPPVIVLYRKTKAHYIQDGHTQQLELDGTAEDLKSFIFHDDRKPLSRWLSSQDKYMVLEAKYINVTSWKDLKLTDKIRKCIFISPVLVFFYCLFIKLGILDGRSGFYYAIQRTLAEILLSLKLIKLKFNIL